MGQGAALPRGWTQALWMARLFFSVLDSQAGRDLKVLSTSTLPPRIGPLTVYPMAGVHSSQGSPFHLSFLAP